MAENKKGFVLYCDLIHTIKKMPNEKAGELFKHILSYVNDENPTTDDLVIELTFEPIKQQLKRDLKKWESISDKRSAIGRDGGLKSAEARRSKLNQIEPIASTLKQNEQVTVKGKVKDKDKDIKEEVKVYASFQHLKLTYDEFDKLIACGFNKKQIDDTIESIQNYKKNTNYVSLYLTLKKWLKSEQGTTTQPVQRTSMKFS